MLWYFTALLFGMVVLVGIGWRLYEFVGQRFCHFYENKQQERDEGCTDAAFGPFYYNKPIFFVIWLLMVTLVADLAVLVKSKLKRVR